MKKDFYRVIIVSILAVTISLSITAGCDSGDEGNQETGVVHPFPAGFLFGTATAGYQVDMGCPTLPDDECVDTASDWYQFAVSPLTVTDPSAYMSGEDPATTGPGHWELYESDFDLAVNDLHNNAFRMSIEWSRIFPESTTGADTDEQLAALANEQAIEHYHEVFAALAARGMTAMVTLNHYTLPVWLHDGVACHLDLDNCTGRGWLDRELAVAEAAKYAGFVAREFGGEVDLWATENEPFAVVLPGYLQPTAERSNPPAVSFRFAETKEVLLALIEAHAAMYEAVKNNDAADADADGSNAEVGLVYAISPVIPQDPNNEFDVIAAENVFYLWNLLFLNAVILGELDDDLDGEAEFRDDLAGRMNWLGINYYLRIAVEGFENTILPDLSPLATFNPLTINYDEVYPRGIYEIVSLVQERFDVPIYITENNAQQVPSGDITKEISLTVEEISWLSCAIADGVDVRGYFYWSLLDNIEWNHGTVPPYGLYQVDSADPDRVRTPRETVDIYGSIAAAGGVTNELAAQYPVNCNDPAY